MGLFVGVEAVEGFEFEAESGGGWAPVIVVEEEQVGAGVEGEGEGAVDDPDLRSSQYPSLASRPPGDASRGVATCPTKTPRH